MTNLIRQYGDLFSSDAPAQAQGVNIDGVMGAGIAPVFKRKHPAMYAEYAEMCARGDLLVGGVHLWISPEITILNLASQDRPGPNARLDWFEEALRTGLTVAEKLGYDRIAMPRIGCGIGGLEWADVEPMLERLAAEQTCDIEVWIQ